MRVLMITSRLPADGCSLDMAPLVRQIESLRRAGADVEVLEVKGPKRWKYVQALPVMRRRASGADVLHAHYAYCGWLARMQWNRPIVCSFMGDDVLGTPDARGRISLASKAVVRGSRLLAGRVDAAVVKSAQMARVLTPAATHVIPNGVDIEAFRPMAACDALRELGWSDDRRYVLFPGNPANPRKGFELARQAVKASGAQTREPMELTTLWGVEPQRVPLYMNACDAMLMTSWLEGSPNVVKEALACNLPVVSVDVGDTVELLSDVEGCRLCPRDPQPLGRALAGLLERGGRSNGRAALLEKRLDLQSVAERLMDVYRSVLSPGGSRLLDATFRDADGPARQAGSAKSTSQPIMN
jgi:glycosyltransferase involved in cell wall biosynthesis